MKTSIPTLAVLCVLAATALPAQTIIHGTSARNDFETFRASFSLAFIDFESVPLGSLSLQLQAAQAVTFFSTISTSGTAIVPPHNAYVSSAGVNGDTSHKLVGTPYAGGSDDGRVGYEIRFDTPQSLAGIERNWQAGNALTRFYSANGTLLGTYTNTVNLEFVSYIADYENPLTWVSRIEIDGMAPGGSRQVGYSDDLFFGIGDIAMIPEPSTWLLLFLGCGMLFPYWHRRPVLPDHGGPSLSQGQK